MKPWRKAFLVLVLVLAAVFLGSGTLLVFKIQGVLSEVTSQRVTVGELWALLFPSGRADLLKERDGLEEMSRFDRAVEVASEHEFVDVVFEPHDSGHSLGFGTLAAGDDLFLLEDEARFFSVARSHDGGYLLQAKPRVEEAPLEPQSPATAPAQASDQAVARPPEAPASTPVASPAEDPDRLNLLLLGIRGEDDPAGGLLTDTIILLSVQQRTGRIAMISIPRDLYVEIPGISGRHKLNAAHAYGHIYYGDGLGLTMETISRVTGVRIHHAALLDFDAFTELIDALGGITVYVDRPLVDPHENLNLSPGYLYMDSDLALRFVRSRLTTTDFDRSRRQRQVLDVLRIRLLDGRNPLLYLELLDTLGRNVRTTLSVTQIRELYELSKRLDFGNVIEFGFDTSPSGPLMSARSQRGEYIILPRAGHFGEMQRIVRNIFN